MPALPDKANITGSVSEGTVKVALDQLIDSLTGTLGASGTLLTANQTLGTAFAGVVAKSGDYTTVLGDRGRVMNVDASGGARTITLLAAATAGDGHVIVVRKSDASANTVTVSGAVLRRTGEFVVCVSTGAAWVTMVSANDDLVPVEYADLTNGGANDLSSYEFTHDFEDGYTYHIVGHAVGSTTGDYRLLMQLRNDAGAVLNTSGDYIAAAQASGATGYANNSQSSFRIFDFSGHAGVSNSFRYDFHLAIHSPMDTGVRTAMRCNSLVGSGASTTLSQTGSVVTTVDGHTNALLFLNTGTFNKGKALLYRTKEPS